MTASLLHAESIRWLIDRLPDDLMPDDFRFHGYRTAYICWEGPTHRLWFDFETPHRIRFDRIHRSGLSHNFGHFNLAMNLQEITDLIRDALEPKP